MSINHNQKLYLFIISFALMSAWLIYNFLRHQDNFWNLTGFIIGAAGLIFTIEDKRNAKTFKAFDDISISIKELKVELRAEMQTHDSEHDKYLFELMSKTAILEHKLELHSEQFSHPKVVEELFKIKDKVSDLNANVSLLSQQGKMAYQLKKVKLDSEKLTELVQGLIDSHPMQQDSPIIGKLGLNPRHAFIPKNTQLS